MKIAFHLLFLAALFCQSAIAQDTSDAKRLKNLGYMKYSSKVNCDSTNGSNIETRICLNIQFQYLDSTLNSKFKYLLSRIENDSVKNQLKQYQSMWVLNRRVQSKLVTEGLEGNTAGIYYLNCMVETTNRRIEELEYLFEMI
ncbi:MAG: lysozyme inhibitor LprI family protein [Crocinitomicaceae bacterium]